MTKFQTTYVERSSGTWWQERETQTYLNADATPTTISTESTLLGAGGLSPTTWPLQQANIISVTETSMTVTYSPSGDPLDEVVVTEYLVADHNLGLACIVTERSDSNQLHYQKFLDGTLWNSGSEAIGYTLYEYDALLRLTAKQYGPKGNRECYTYGIVGDQITETWEEHGTEMINKKTYTYHSDGTVGAGQVNRIETILTATEKAFEYFEYGGRGELLYHWGGSVYPRAYTYDALGRLETLST